MRIKGGGEVRETYVTYKLWDGQHAPNNLESNGRLIGNYVSMVSVDRDALLKLADEMQDVARCVRLSGNVAVGWVDGWSNRIRDICGVKDDA